MSIQNIIFDWDGTIARTLDLWLAGYKCSLERRNLRFDSKEIVAEFFQNHHEVPERHPDIDFPVIVEETRDYVFQASHAVNLYEGAIELLNLLKLRGKSVSLVSSSPRQLLNSGLAAHTLTEYFPSTIAGDDGYGHKPDTLPFVETLSRMGATASDTLVIGDSHVDILAGKSAGCKTCLFVPSQNELFYNFEHLRSFDADIEIDYLPNLLQYV